MGGEREKEYEWMGENWREREGRIWEREVEGWEKFYFRFMNVGIVFFFLNLIYYIIIFRKKKILIFWRNGDVFMENLGILVYNRFGVKKLKRLKVEFLGV